MVIFFSVSSFSFALIDSIDAVAAAAATATTIATGEKLPVGDPGLNMQRLGVASLNQKLSTTSSTTSIEHSSFCARLYQKCQMVCCICTPNYL